MVDEPMTEEEARRLFAAYLAAVDARGPAPDCHEPLAAIDAEFDAECAKLRQAQTERKVRRRR